MTNKTRDQVLEVIRECRHRTARGVALNYDHAAIIDECVDVARRFFGKFTPMINAEPYGPNDVEAVRRFLDVTPQGSTQISYVWLIVAAKLSTELKLNGFLLQPNEFMIDPHAGFQPSVKH